MNDKFKEARKTINAMNEAVKRNVEKARSSRESDCSSAFVLRELQIAAAKSECTGIELLVCEDISKRQEKGIKKYGTTVANSQEPDLNWLQHAYEESLDLAIYLKKLIEIGKRSTDYTEKYGIYAVPCGNGWNPRMPGGHDPDLGWLLESRPKNGWKTWGCAVTALGKHLDAIGH